MKYNIVEDSNYGYMRAEPIPTQEEVEQYYKDEFYSAQYKKFNDSELDIQKEEIEFFEFIWSNVNAALEPLLLQKEKKTLFDIGFGYGLALTFFHNNGYQVSGLEPTKEGYTYAKSKGFNVYNCGIETFDCVGDKRFDVVTLFNVLEHLRNPAEVLQNIKKELLAEDGILVIDVPNEFNDFQTIGNKEYNLNEWWLCPPNHINYFSATTLIQTLEKCGYDVLDYYSSFPLEIFLLMGENYVGNPTLGKECHNRRVSFEKMMTQYGKKEKMMQFYKALADLDLGRQITVFAKAKK